VHPYTLDLLRKLHYDVTGLRSPAASPAPWSRI
jgi:hypothetical protein